MSPIDILTQISLQLGYQFRQPHLLELALTDANTAQISHQKGNNERLEFLGDAVLGMAISALLYEHYPHEDEGDLAKRRSALVCQKQLTAIARIIGIPSAMQNPIDSLLENAMEAVLGAIFLDSGYQEAAAVVRHLWQPALEQMPLPPQDAKSALQEWSQGQGLGLPSYLLVDQSGPAHAPVFTMEVTIGDTYNARATASNKREAEKAAASLLLAKVTS